MELILSVKPDVSLCLISNRQAAAATQDNTRCVRLLEDIFSSKLTRHATASGQTIPNLFALGVDRSTLCAHLHPSEIA